MSNRRRGDYQYCWNSLKTKPPKCVVTGDCQSFNRRYIHGRYELPVRHICDTCAAFEPDPKVAEAFAWEAHALYREMEKLAPDIQLAGAGRCETELLKDIWDEGGRRILGDMAAVSKLAQTRPALGQAGSSASYLQCRLGDYITYKRKSDKRKRRSQ